MRKRGGLSMHDVTVIDRQPNVAIDKAVLFSMRNLPLLEQGTTYDPLATAENLWVNIKVYASGGENALHSHGGEDHAFIVLQGKATFTFGDGRTVGRRPVRRRDDPEERALQVRGRPERKSRAAAHRRRRPQGCQRPERSVALRHAQGHHAADRRSPTVPSSKAMPPRTAKRRKSASTPRENTSRRIDRRQRASGAALGWLSETSGDDDARITR